MRVSHISDAHRLENREKHFYPRLSFSSCRKPRENKQVLGAVPASSDYVIVYIWAPDRLSSGNSKRLTGHVSMRLVRADGTPIPSEEGGYISVWPSRQDGSVFLRTLAEDCKEEAGQQPDQRFKISHIDVDAIQAEFKRIRDQEDVHGKSIQWGIYGAGFFRSNFETNCSGLVLNLLINFGNFSDPYRKGKMQISRLDRLLKISQNNFSAPEDIVDMIQAKGSYMYYVYRLMPVIFFNGLTALGNHLGGGVTVVDYVAWIVTIDRIAGMVTKAIGISPADIETLLSNLAREDAGVTLLAKEDIGYKQKTLITALPAHSL